MLALITVDDDSGDDDDEVCEKNCASGLGREDDQHVHSSAGRRRN